jgi:hypothetical protein
MVRHIEQLAPVLTENDDVVAWLEAGFIGCWGEWHSSTHELDGSSESKLRIVGEMLQRWPGFALQIRYPVDLRLLRSRLSPDLDVSRLGFHNDCVFASEPDDFGTWARGGGSVSGDKRYVSAAAESAPTGGETCNLSSRSHCDIALEEFAAQGWTDLNGGFHADVLGQLAKEGCLETIASRLGYRFRLLRASVEASVNPGQPLEVGIELVNDGWARLYRARRLHVVLASAESRLELETEADASEWVPGGPRVVRVSVAIPETTPAGVYDLGVSLPDPAPSLAHDPRQSIRFANRDVWDGSGINWLGLQVRIGEPSLPSDGGGGGEGGSGAAGDASIETGGAGAAHGRGGDSHTSAPM